MKNRMTEKQISEAIKREEKRQAKLNLPEQPKIELLPADYHIGKFCTPYYK